MGLAYFKCYPADFLSDPPVMAMNHEELGLYWHCLLISWRNEGIPADRERLARMLRISLNRLEKLWPALAELWVDGPEGKLVNPRQERERAEAAESHARRVAAGRKGGKARATPAGAKP
jgi:uncharacterized protein YdaU (DUF1376 family)